MKSARGISLSLSDIVKLVEPDLPRVEAGLERDVRSALPLVNDINRYLHNGGGKRFRPLLLLLCARLCGYRGDPAVRLGVVVELIHVATLVHDDIIDDADLRRGQPSVNAKWGNQVTVLAGDWLYMTAFYLALELRELRILDILIDVTRTMAEGELMQLEQGERMDLGEEEQLDICHRKTARLFAACAQLGAILGGECAEREERLAQYGHSLGMAFQLVDDLLDYTSDEGTLGKPVLKDLEEGKLTLPLIYLLEKATPEECSFVRSVVRERRFSPRDKERIIALVRRYGTLPQVRRLAETYALKARTSLESFPDSPIREALLCLPDYIIARKS